MVCMEVIFVVQCGFLVVVVVKADGRTDRE